LILKTEPSFFQFLRQVGRKRIRRWALGSLCVGAPFVLGILFEATYPVSQLQIDYLRLRGKFYRTFYSRPSALQTLSIDIKFAALQKIKQSREVALKQGFISETEKQFISASLTHQGRRLAVKLRLKGDNLDHLSSDKWSFRIKVLEKRALLGMRSFSIHAPQTRNYIGEYIFLKMLGQEGLITHKYDFVQVLINGEDKGLYAIEEHFEAALLARSERREGPIIKFDEETFWKSRILWNTTLKERKRFAPGDYFSMPITVFGDWDQEEEQRHLFGRAKDLLEGFRSGYLSASEVFNSKLLGKTLALVDLFGGSHAIHANQFRFYYNRIIDKLEMIPFDAMAGGSNRTSMLLASHWYLVDNDWQGGNIKFPLIRLLFDRQVQREYLKELERVSEKEFLDDFFEESRADFQLRIAFLKWENPLYQHEKSILYDNQKYIRLALKPNQTIAAYARPEKGGFVLELGNLHSLPVEILGLRNARGIETTLDPIVLEKREPGSPILYMELNITHPVSKKMRVSYRILGTSRIYEQPVTAWSHYEQPQELLNPNSKKIPSFVTLDDKTKVFKVAAGQHRLDQNMLIPKGYLLQAGRGTRIDMVRGARIITHSPVTLIGDRKSPILITSSDGTGQGIAVLNTNKMSQMKWVQFENLRAPEGRAQSLTGSVTFYQSPVNISNCLFENNLAGDDYLNLIRSRFNISDTLFRNVKADAIDVDFGKGRLENVFFNNIGNDGLDLSGTEVIVINGEWDTIGDKAISVGENSKVELKKIRIRNARIAVASKDRSTVDLESGWIADSHRGLVVFQKKPEFGPAEIRAKDISFVNVARVSMVEKGSTLALNGKSIRGELTQVRSLIYP